MASVAETEENRIQNILASNYSGIEGMPYQFHEDVDARPVKHDKNGKKTGDYKMTLGRKYTEKMYSRMPLLFITPCTAQFMDDFNKLDKVKTIGELIKQYTGEGADVEVLANSLTGSGRFYTPKFAYTEYFNYLNPMLQAVASFLGLRGVTIQGGNTPINLGGGSWNNEINDNFRNYWSAKENIIFYLDSFNEVSQSVSNTFGDSQLAATINGFADTANEIKFLFGTNGNAIADALGGSKELLTSVTSSISEALGSLGGGIVGSLASSGIDTVMNGGKIVFPQVWQDSNMDESYSFNFKFRSPDHDSLSIFLNVLKPYCKLLALAMAHQDSANVNGYNSPFVVKAYCKGKVAIDLGGITSLNVTKGAECQWNDDGLPTQIDVSMEIQNLYSHLAISNYNDLGKIIRKNTAYMDFLANMAGLNVNQMELGKRTIMKAIIKANKYRNIPSRIASRFDQGVSNLVGSLYNLGL